MDSTNEVDSHLLSELKLALEKALSLPMEEMKGARLDRLANGHRTAAGGAGLGLMDLRITLALFHAFQQVHQTFGAARVEVFQLDVHLHF